MADETIDSLQIEISSSPDKAISSLDKLISNLKKLDKIGKSPGLENCKKQLQGIAKIKFENLSTELAAITQYIRELRKQGKKLSEIVMTAPTINTESIKGSVDDMVSEVNRGKEVINDTLNEKFDTTPKTNEMVEKVKSECQDILNSYNDLATQVQTQRDKLNSILNSKKENFGNTPQFQSSSAFELGINDSLQKLSIQVDLLEQQFKKLSEADGDPDTEEWKRLEKQLITVRQQYQSLLRQTNKNAVAMDQLGKEAVKSTSFITKMFNNLKRVAFYRVVRFFLSQISNAAKDGLENIAKFSKESNAVMSQYKSEFTYMKNSVGSALIPMLESVLPIVIRIGDGFVEIMNSVGMISAAINGDDTFVKAKKTMENYAQAVDEAKRSTVGFDEINVLGKKEDESNYSEMFEEVEVGAGGVIESIGKLTALIGSVVGLLIVFKKDKLVENLKSIGKSFKTWYSSLKDMKTWQKGAISVAALAAEAMVCYNTFYDLTTGSTSLGNALLTLIPVCAAVGVAMYAMWGVIGVVIGVIVALVSAIAGVAKAQIDMQKEASMAEFWAVEGAAIEDVTKSMNNYFQSLGITKQQQMNEALDEAASKLIDARLAYDGLWDSVKNSENIDTKQIEKLSEAFSNLADATNAFNSAAIESALASLRTGIEMNITPELTQRLEGLVGSLQAAQDLLGVKVSGLNTEYQKILNDVASGKKSVSEAKPQLEELREKMNTLTLTDNTSSEKWNIAMQEAVNKGIAAGHNKDELESSLNSLTSERDTYLQTIKDAYANNVSVMKQLIEIDKTQFGGALGFSEADLATIAENYNAQLELINNQYNQVIQSIYDTLKANSLDYEAYAGEGMGITGGFTDFLDTVGAGIGGLFGWMGLKDSNGDTGWEHIGNKNAAKEQKEILDWILEQMKNIEGDKVEVPAHAKGGFVEDGFFMANSNELVGEFSNGRNAVANNMQIIEGIKQGVSEAMQESNQGGDWTIQIVDADGDIKSETIITAAERKNRRDGKTIISVGG